MTSSVSLFDVSCRLLSAGFELSLLLECPQLLLFSDDTRDLGALPDTLAVFEQNEGNGDEYPFQNSHELRHASAHVREYSRSQATEQT